MFKKVCLSCTLLFSGCTAVSLQNDVFSGHDREFTHGTTVSNIAPIKETNILARTIAPNIPRIPFLHPDKKVNFAETRLEQLIYTPDDLEVSGIVEDQNPYAGVLIATIGAKSLSKNRSNTTELQIGVTGPPSGAEWLQTFAHDDLDLGTVPQGWDNQIRTEPVFNYNVVSEKIDYKRKLYYFEVDSIKTLRANLGTIQTNLVYERLLRIGKNIPTMLGYDKPFAGFFYIGTRGEAVLRKVFFDGGVFRNSPHTVNSKTLQAGAKTGVNFKVYEVVVDFSFNLRTPTYDDTDNPHSYWILSVSKALDLSFSSKPKKQSSSPMAPQ